MTLQMTVCTVLLCKIVKGVLLISSAITPLDIKVTLSDVDSDKNGWRPPIYSIHSGCTTQNAY